MTIAVGGRVRTKRVRAAANLGIGAVENTASVPCFSARMIGFLLTATDPDTIAGAVVQVSNDNVNFVTVDSSTMSVDDVGTVIGVALNAGGRWMVLVNNGLATTARYPVAIPWFYARMQVTGGAAQTDGLQIDAYVWDDLAFAMDAKGVPPSVVP